MASIRKRGSNSYLIVVSRGYDYEGNRLKSVQKTVKPPKEYTPKQAEKWVKEQAILFEREVQHSPEPINRSITLAKYIEHWAADVGPKKLADSTFRRDEQDIRRILPALGNYKLTDLRKEVIREFYEKMRHTPRLDGRGNLSEKSVEGLHNTLCSVLSSAVDEGYLTHNPAWRCYKPKGQKKERPVADEETVKKLITAFEGQSMKYETYFKLVLATGLRRGEACAGASAICFSVKREKKTEQPPKLYDLTTLQREANRLFGFTAKQTLDYAQQLYEKKLLTYPRTDSQYLTEDMGQTAQHLVSDLLGLLPFAQGLALTAEVGRVLNSKKVSDHHAIIPTSEFVKQGFTGLAESECKLINLVCSKLLCAIAAPHEYETVTAVLSCAGNEFTAKGKTVLVPGWKEIDQRFRSTLKADGEEEAESLNTLPELAERQSFRVTSTVSEHFTSPPKAYTEDTLLSAMERAGAEDMPEDKVNCSAGAREGGLGQAERKGLGTPATRAAILEKLVQIGFVQRKGKQLVPTKDGINLAVVLPESLTSPALTAEWENRLTEIAKGNADPDEFMAEIEAQVRQLVKTYSCISADAQNLFQSERVIIGKCPRCGENVYEGKKNFYCGNRGCQFVMWKNDRFFEQRKKAFTPKIAAALLKNGKAKVKGLYSEKTGKTYDATVLLADTGGKYVNYRVERKE